MALGQNPTYAHIYWSKTDPNPISATPNHIDNKLDLSIAMCNFICYPENCNLSLKSVF